MISLSPTQESLTRAYFSSETLPISLRIYILEFLSPAELAISEIVSRNFVPPSVWQSHYKRLSNEVMRVVNSTETTACSKNYKLPCVVYQKMLRDPQLLSGAARKAVNAYLSSHPLFMTSYKLVVCVGIGAVAYKIMRSQMHSMQEGFVRHGFSGVHINACTIQNLEENTTNSALKVAVCMIPITFICINPRHLILITERIAQKSVFMRLKVKSIYKLVRHSSVLSQAIAGLTGRISELYKTVSLTYLRLKNFYGFTGSPHAPHRKL